MNNKNNKIFLKLKYYYQDNKNQVKFFLITLIIYLIFFFINKNLFQKITSFFLNILENIIFPFILIILFITLINYFFKPKKLIKHLTEKNKIKAYIIAIISGIISSGPIYLWYPMLAELKEHGMKDSLIAVFLYNRAIKIPLLPLFITYFNIKIALLMFIMMIIFSIIEGLIFELIEPV